MITVGFSTRKGGVFGFFSALIRWVTKSRFSHVWLRYWHELYDTDIVVEASITGIIETPYDRYVNVIANAIELIPPDGVAMLRGMPELGQSLDTAYDVPTLFGRLWVFVNAWIGKKVKNPLGNTKNDCCVENVIRCLRSASPAYAELDAEVETPQSLYDRLVKDGWKPLEPRKG